MRARAHHGPAVLLLLLLCAAACGQKDPPVVTDRGYYPLRDGATWKYLHSKNGWVENVALTAVDGESDSFEQTQTANPDGESSTSRLVVQRDGDVLRVAEEQLVDDELAYSVEYDPGFLRFSAAWVEQDPGFSETREYQRTETEAGMSAKDPKARAHVYTVESVSETVTVPAGTFQNCLRVRRERDLEVSSDDAGAADQSEQEKLFWFAPGVGKVREENVVSESTEELIDYDLPEEP